jgi:hypothetical protein
MKRIILIVLIFLIGSIVFLFFGKAPKQEEISWGITFSQKYAQDLGLDWQETYLSLVDDLSVKKMRIAFYWDIFEPREKEFNFLDFDWQVEQAEKRNIEIIPIIGIKVPRWPECHVPSWAENLSQEEQQKKILEMIEKIVLRYKDSPSVIAWQVENEPFLDFGVCPWYDQDFFLEEVALVKSLDPETPIMVTESGELSFWFKGAKTGDIVGVTMYRRTWWHRAGGFYFKYPIKPVHYYRKAEIVRRIFNKQVICVELQAEPWGPSPTYVLPLEEQEKSMNLDLFKENIDYAQRTGLPEFYLWGAEWWYWMKEKNNQPEIWQEAQKLFQ